MQATKPQAFTRMMRHVLTGLCQLAVLVGSASGVAPQVGDSEKFEVNYPSPIESQGFDLHAVRLLDGPYRDAMQRNAKYLLLLEPDRLLSRVRKYAGLEPKGPAYGGWESMGISSSSAGHYLSACALMYAASGDERFKERVDYMVKEMAECQAAHGDGYLTGIPRGREIFEDVARGDIRSQGFDLNGGWVPYYTMHKIVAGLRDAYVLADNDQAKDVLIKLVDYNWSIVKDLSDEQMQQVLACEHGGMNEVAADVYAITGDPNHLALAHKFHHKAVLDPLQARQDRLSGLHANTQVPKVIGLARLYELTGDSPSRTAAEFFWDTVVNHYSYVNGGNSYNEHFGPRDRQAGLLHDTTETCNTYNMLKLTRHLHSWRPNARYMDYYELALLNHILAHQHPQTGMLMYKGFLEHGVHKTFSTPFDSFWCCVGTGMENHVKYGEAIYSQVGDELLVDLFISSELQWSKKKIKITQESELPYGENVTLKLAAPEPTEAVIKLRKPAWAAGELTIEVNGDLFEAVMDDNGYLTVNRTWSDGDRVEIHLPMAFRLETMQDDPRQVAFFYGPTLLSATLEEDSPLPVLVGDRGELLSQIKATDEPLVFLSEELWPDHVLHLRPLFTVADERYSVYLEHFTQDQWEAEKKRREIELAKQRELERRTADFFQPGQMQPERDHNFTGEKVRTGQHNGSFWRDADDGGWFSFEMAVDPRQPMNLVCTFWGSDQGNRTFDILVDGEKIATQSLNRPRPNEFVDMTYSLPKGITAGKQKVTVKLDAHPGHIAGGLFGCRTIRAEEAEE